MKHKPGDKCRGCSFQCEKQRGSGSISPGEPEHQQQGADNASGDNRAGEPRRITATKRHLAGVRKAEHRRGQPAQQRHANTSSAIEQAGEHRWMERAKQSLRGWG